MTEIVKSPAMLVLILAAALIVLFFLFTVLFDIKIGRAVCTLVGTLIFNALSPLLSSLTVPGITSACNLLPI